VWSYDFVFDRCANGQQLKCLTVTDEFTKEGLAIDLDGRIRSPRVIEVLARLVSERGAPAFLRSDNGPEFVSKAILSWVVSQGISTALIDSGKPWQNGVTESFNGKFRDECLSLEWFRSRAEAKVIIEAWRRHYNVASYCPSLYVIDANRSGSRFGCPAGADRRLRARSTRRLAASRAERLKSQGPSSSGCNASIWRCPAARRRVFGLMPSEAAACVKFIQPSASAVSDR
jgi:putative transposase